VHAGPEAIGAESTVWLRTMFPMTRPQGGGGVGHGGIIATLLDEAMGKVCRFREARAVTAEMSIQFLKPVRGRRENKLKKGGQQAAE